jgi:hypothetical protein
MSLTSTSQTSIFRFAPGELTAGGHVLNLSPENFGPLRDSSAIAFEAPLLRERLAQEGYLFLPGLLDRDEVLGARREVAARLASAGFLAPQSDPLECVLAPTLPTGDMPSATRDNSPLMHLLYGGPMMAFYQRLLGGEVRHFDYTWFRVVAPGGCTPAHTDAVYMNRGTHQLYTSWTPIGDVPLEMGGLMVLENSHQHRKLRENYSMKDVDAFCENKVGADFQGMGGGGNIRSGGYLSHTPHLLRENLGGRWLTADFQAGDLLMFSIFTVHASLDNHSNRYRLSSDSRYQLASETADERWIGPNPAGHGAHSKRGMIC